MPDTVITSVVRFDVGRVKGSVKKTTEGYLNADAVVTRTGVFCYVKSDGSIRRELRHPSEVFASDSLASLRMKPMTNDHPPVRILNAETAKTFQVGFTGENVRADEKYVMAPLVVTDAHTIDQVEKGKKELSCGYTCDLVVEDGEYEGQRYDHKQTNIRYNHVAIVERGRAGADVRINLDSLEGEDGFQIDDQQTNQRGSTMPKITLDGIEYDAAPEVINALTKAQDALKTASTNHDAVKSDLDKVTAERDALKTKLDTTEQSLPATVAAAVKSRLDLERVAAPLLPAETKMDTMTDKEIRVAVIKAASPEAKLDDASDVYIQARFDTTVELSGKRDDAMSKQRQASGSRQQSNNDGCGSADESRQRMIDRITKKATKK